MRRRIAACDHRDMAVTEPLRPPLRGEWLVLNPPGHSRYAFDLVRIDPGTKRAARGSFARFLVGRLRADDVFGWEQRVFAPLDGEVVAAHHSEPDRSQLRPLVDGPASFIRPLLSKNRLEKVAGNHIVLSTVAGYVLLAHLRQRSVTVKVGDRVEAGQQLGLVGNSGNTAGPHLHIQVMDQPNPFDAQVTEFRLTQFNERSPAGDLERTNSPLPHRRTHVWFNP
jgi:hypothetical protein